MTTANVILMTDQYRRLARKDWSDAPFTAAEREVMREISLDLQRNGWKPCNYCKAFFVNQCPCCRDSEVPGFMAGQYRTCPGCKRQGMTGDNAMFFVIGDDEATGRDRYCAACWPDPADREDSMDAEALWRTDHFVKEVGA